MTGSEVSHYITVLNVSNTLEQGGGASEDHAQYKVIIFHCLNVEHQRQLTKQTQYCVVGDFLCHRDRTR